MKLSKAIELSIEAEKSLRDHKFIDHADAVKLGAEAMKHLKAQYDPDHQMMRELLPGEDEE